MQCRPETRPTVQNCSTPKSLSENNRLWTVGQFGAVSTAHHDARRAPIFYITKMHPINCPNCPDTSVLKGLKMQAWTQTAYGFGQFARNLSVKLLQTVQRSDQGFRCGTRRRCGMRRSNSCCTGPMASTRCTSQLRGTMRSRRHGRLDRRAWTASIKVRMQLPSMAGGFRAASNRTTGICRRSEGDIGFADDIHADALTVHSAMCRMMDDAGGRAW